MIPGGLSCCHRLELFKGGGSPINPENYERRFGDGAIVLRYAVRPH
jgi:hypothetical protein